MSAEEKVKVTAVKKKRKGVDDNMTQAEKQAVDKEIQDFKEELTEEEHARKLEEQRNELRETEPTSTPAEVELVDLPPSAPLTLSVDELAKLIRAAQGIEERPHLVHQLPENATVVDRVQLACDDALGEVGRGAHRVLDGAKDILGGVVDIITLGRAHRK